MQKEKEGYHFDVARERRCLSFVSERALRYVASLTRNDVASTSQIDISRFLASALPVIRSD